MKVGWEGARGTTEERCLDILKMEMVSIKLPNAVFGNVFALVTAILGFRHSFTYGLWRKGAATFFQETIFS